jgi:predicted NBD/HSP70 family sugar kinase
MRSDRGADSPTADQATVRRHNLAVVLTHLRDNGPRSRARVADDTGLNKATVSSLVAELVDRRLVREGEAERGAVGRPGQTIGLDGEHVVALAAEVNVDFIAALAMNLRGEVVAERRVPLDTAGSEPAPVLNELAALVKRVAGPLQRGGARPAGLAVAMPGLVETATGILDDAPNLGWSKVRVRDELGERLGGLGVEIRLENEANVGALAEVAARSGSSVRNLLLLTGAAGVGGGIVTAGRLVRGEHGFAGEVGHMRVDPAGRRCGCGQRGCWETVVGLNALLAAAANRNDPVRDPALDVAERLAELDRRAAAGHGRTLAALDDVATWLALGAGMLVNVLNPEVLVLGGWFAALGHHLAEPLEADLAAHVYAPGAGGCRVECSTLGFSAALRGGALQVLDAVFDDPTVVAPGDHTNEPRPRRSTR